MKKVYTIPQTTRIEAQDIYCLAGASSVTSEESYSGTPSAPVIGGAPARKVVFF